MIGLYQADEYHCGVNSICVYQTGTDKVISHDCVHDKVIELSLLPRKCNFSVHAVSLYIQYLVSHIKV